MCATRLRYTPKVAVKATAIITLLNETAFVKPWEKVFDVAGSWMQLTYSHVIGSLISCALIDLCTPEGVGSLSNRIPSVDSLLPFPYSVYNFPEGVMMLDKGALLRKLLRWTGRIPTECRLLYPFWLSAQLDTVVDERSFPQLPQSLDGLVLAFASDIHFGPLLNQRRLQDLVNQINDMKADLILLGGDYGEDTATAIQCFEAMPPLHARHGVYAAIGNHDRMGTALEFAHLLKAMENKQVTALYNQAVTLAINGTAMRLCSVDDVKRGNPDFTPLISSEKNKNFTIFMPHSPDALPMAEIVTDFHYDLVLAGHTHGGQLVMFGRSLHSSSRYGDRFRSGWMTFDGKPLLVTHGVGTSLLPIRLGAKAQVHRITLRSQAASSNP